VSSLSPRFSCMPLLHSQSRADHPPKLKHTAQHGPPKLIRTKLRTMAMVRIDFGPPLEFGGEIPCGAVGFSEDDCISCVRNYKSVIREVCAIIFVFGMGGRQGVLGAISAVVPRGGLSLGSCPKLSPWRVKRCCILDPVQPPLDGISNSDMNTCAGPAPAKRLCPQRNCGARIRVTMQTGSRLGFDQRKN
jgi:hypothetical protein